jgi:hypothetical protein
LLMVITITLAGCQSGQPVVPASEPTPQKKAIRLQGGAKGDGRHKTMNTFEKGEEPELHIINLPPDHMVDHPAGAHSVLWNGPAFLDVGVPAGGFVRFALANLPPQWTLLKDEQNRQLPVAARYDGRSLMICWLPYDGPGARKGAQTGGGMSDADRAAALQKLSATRHEGLINAARGIGGRR